MAFVGYLFVSGAFAFLAGLVVVTINEERRNRD